MTTLTDFEAIDKYLTEREAYIRRSRQIITVMSVIASLIVLVYILVSVVFQINLIHGDSMNNTLRNGEIAVSLRHYEALSVGDIVILRNTDENDYIKRVVALPGDTVDINEQSGTLIINGKATNEPYAYGKTVKTNELVEFPLKLNENEYFVLGDNREHSYDSRYFGAIPLNRIGGVVILFGKN